MTYTTGEEIMAGDVVEVLSNGGGHTGCFNVGDKLIVSYIHPSNAEIKTHPPDNFHHPRFFKFISRGDVKAMYKGWTNKQINIKEN